MITLAIYEKVIDDGILQRDGFFWEEMPIGAGVWLVTRSGSDVSNSLSGLNLKSTLDFYVAYKNKVKTEQTHLSLLRWILDNKCICELSGTVGGAGYEYRNIRLRPTATPNNEGVSPNGFVVKMASASVVYDLAE